MNGSRVIRLPTVRGFVRQRFPVVVRRPGHARALNAADVGRTVSGFGWPPDGPASPQSASTLVPNRSKASNMRHTPILKAKRAELVALSTQQIICQVEPVFEIQPAQWLQDNNTGKSVGTDAA